MRVNVYNEEITLEYEFVSKHVEETGKTYYGWRVFLKSAPELHHSENDDDRTAITFWFGTKERACNFLNKAYMDALQDLQS
jgi:hypothetical protein